jgi:Flp pilus assembly protein TadD
LLSAHASAAEPALATAQRLFNEKEYSRAADLLRRSLEEDPDRAGAHALLGHAYFELGRLDEAGASFNQAIALGRLTSDVLARLGQIALARERLPAALNSLRLASLLAPEDDNLELAAAATAERAGLHDEAESVYRDLLAADPSRADVHLRLGNLYLLTERPRKALKPLLLAYHLGESSPALARTIGELYVNRGDLHGAVEWYQRLRLLKPKQPEGIALRCARLMASAGDPEGASKLAHTLLKSQKGAVAGDARLLLGQIAASRGAVDEAVLHWRAAAAAGRAGPDVHAWLGSYFRRKGNHAEAALHLRKRLSAGAMDQSLARALISSLIQLQDLEGARRELVVMIEHFGMDEHAESLVRRIARAQPPAEG